MYYEETLNKLVQHDDRFVVLTAENRAAIRNLPALIGDRFIDTGITEQTMIGTSAGLALRGRVPVIHALASFLTMRAFEFIRTDIGIGSLNVKLVGGAPGFLSEANGPTHQAIEDISLMRGIPGMNIFCPSDEEDMMIGLNDILNSPKPFYIRFNSLKSAVKHSELFAIGKAEIINFGEDITILTYGLLLRQAYEAMMILEMKGYTVRLINLRTLKPIDEAAVMSAARETSMVVCLEDHFQTGGLYSIVGELFLKHNITNTVIPISLNERWFKPALLPDVLEYEQFTGPAIAEKISSSYEEHIENIKVKSLI